jgi:hypothetical protein
MLANIDCTVQYQTNPPSPTNIYRLIPPNKDLKWVLSEYRSVIAKRNAPKGIASDRDCLAATILAE